MSGLAKWLAAEAHRLEAETEDCREHLITAAENKDDDAVRLYSQRLYEVTIALKTTLHALYNSSS